MNTNREKIVIKTSIISIITNIILATIKIIIGILSKSIAIVLDAVNNASDGISSIIAIIGTKLANKSPDRNHPYGYGRIEYMTELTISAIILYAGITSFIESVKKIINPEEASYTNVTIAILIISIITKYVLSIYVKRKGREINSDSLVASGYDAFNDSILTLSVLVSAIIYILFKISLEAYIGIIISIFIIKTGFGLIKESVDNMLGVRVESSLSKSIKKEIMKEEVVQGVYDLVLNDYGPDRYLGSVHIEIPDTLTVADVDTISRNISKNIKEKYGVILHTIGVYSVNTKDKKIIETRKNITKIVFSHKEILQMHGFYINEEEKDISFDIIIDFEAKDREKIYKQIYDQVKSKYPDYKINIALDIDTSD